MYAPSDRATLTRHARRDTLSKDFLGKVYASVKQRLGGTSLGRVALDDLRRDLQAEKTPVRVAISLLEQVGLLRRWQDIPRTATLGLKRAVPSGESDLAAFCHAARLQYGQLLEMDLLAVGQQAALDVRNLEHRMLAWASAGWLEYRSSRRDPLLELLAPPTDAPQRLSALLDQYEKIQGQRVAEIVAYANTRRCRHGHISGYLGGRTITQCKSCDNCLDLSPAQPRTPRQRKEKRLSVPVDVSSVPDDDPLFQRLRAWRLEKAREEGVPAFVIAHNSLLRNIAVSRPRTGSDMLAIKGMGPRKLEKYGMELLALVREETE